MSKQYTLTQKGSVRGPIDEDTKQAKYVYIRGQVIDEDQYKELIKRHKDQFEEGVIDLVKKPSPKESAQDKTITELVERVEKLEVQVTELTEQKAASKAAPKK